MCGWARRLEDGRGDGGGDDRSQVTGPPPPPPVWSPDDLMLFPSAGLLPWATPLEGSTEVEDGSEKPGFNEELSRCEGYRVGTGGGWRNQAAANYLGPSRALPADCFSCGWIFGSARCGWERVATLWGLSSGSESEGHKLLGLPYQVIWGGM